MSATNGSSIGTFGTTYVIVCYYGHTFIMDLMITSNAIPIIGKEFLYAYRLLGDVGNHCLIAAVSFATFPCQKGGSGPLMYVYFR